jgi:hypothetical protein
MIVNEQPSLFALHIVFVVLLTIGSFFSGVDGAACNPRQFNRPSFGM